MFNLTFSFTVKALNAFAVQRQSVKQKRNRFTELLTVGWCDQEKCNP